MKPVILISANSEWRAVKELLHPVDLLRSPFGSYFHTTINQQPVTFLHGGWGKISAAATAQYAIDHFSPDLLVNLGTCGGFEGRVEAGTIILVDRTIVYDIIEQMSDSDTAIGWYSSEIDLSWVNVSTFERLNVGTLKRSHLVSADRDLITHEIPMLIEKYDAIAGDWESGAIAWVAGRNRVALLMLRGVSDLVSPGGGEAYGNVELFRERTKDIMKNLLNILPGFLEQFRIFSEGKI